MYRTQRTQRTRAHTHTPHAHTGTDFFKLLVKAFQKAMALEQNTHLRNFYIIVPPLCVNFMEHMMSARDRLNKGKHGKDVRLDPAHPLRIGRSAAVGVWACVCVAWARLRFWSERASAAAAQLWGLSGAAAAATVRRVPGRAASPTTASRSVLRTS